MEGSYLLFKRQRILTMERTPSSTEQWIDRAALLHSVTRHYGPHAKTSIHGVQHWQNVEHHGLKIAEDSGADIAVVTLFAWFHDSCRVNEHIDDGHGKRAAEFAATQRGKLYDLPDHAYALLMEACNDHTCGKTITEITIGTCWDADRLDLPRVGTLPREAFMSTEKGRRLAYQMRVTG